VDEKPKGSDRDGKTVISFAPGIEFGGIAHSKDWDKDGIIHYAEITYDTNQQILPTFLWHEMAHTVSAGGHINKWPSVVSEVEGNGTIFAMDEKIFNCIYNSPPLRSYWDNTILTWIILGWYEKLQLCKLTSIFLYTSLIQRLIARFVQFPGGTIFKWNVHEKTHSQHGII